jgi:hypothetical protein
MEYAEEIEAQKRIRANISTLYEGRNAISIPVKNGHVADLKNPKPILAQVIGETTRFTVAPWVDMESWFQEIGLKSGQYTFVRDGYTVSTKFLEEGLNNRMRATGTSATASIPDR